MGSGAIVSPAESSVAVRLTPEPAAVALSAVLGVAAAIVNSVVLMVKVPATIGMSKPALSSGEAWLTACPTAAVLWTSVGVASATMSTVNDPTAAVESTLTFNLLGVEND